MRNILSGARGMSPVVLVILIAWALLSVIFLTGTLLAARSIDRSVSGVTNRVDENGKPEKNIYDTVQEIGKEGKFIDEARKTVAISTAIRKAADPLSGHLARTLVIADKGILPRLNTINSKVVGIIDIAGQINSNVVSIHGTVGQIDERRARDRRRRWTRSTRRSWGIDCEDQGDQRERSRDPGQPLVGPLARAAHRRHGGHDRRSGEARSTASRRRSSWTSRASSRTSAASRPSQHANTVVGHANGIDCSTSCCSGSEHCNKMIMAATYTDWYIGFSLSFIVIVVVVIIVADHPHAGGADRGSSERSGCGRGHGSRPDHQPRQGRRARQRLRGPDPAHGPRAQEGRGGQMNTHIGRV